MNPTLSEARIAAAIAEDPERGQAEWGAEWRAGVSTFLEPALIDACIRAEPRVIPPRSGVVYAGAVDPSGGGDDEFAWAVAHQEGERVVVDLLGARGRRGRQPLDLEAAVREAAADLALYGLTACVGDRYAASWTVEAFQRHGIKYEHAERVKSDVYLELLPLVTMARLELPDDPELVKQAKLLERKPGAGKDRIDHPPGGHDDRINAAAMAATAAAEPSRRWANLY